MAESEQQLLKKASTHTQNSISSWLKLLNSEWSEEDSTRIAQFLSEDMKRLNWLLQNQRELKFRSSNTGKSNASQADKKSSASKSISPSISPSISLPNKT